MSEKKSNFPTVDIPIQLDEGVVAPSYASSGASGADLRANISEPLILEAGKATAVPTGIKLAIPAGYEVQIRPRSGLAFKNQISVLNTPGTIDSDYRGEIKVILINYSQTDFEITPGMRIAQAVLTPVCQMQFETQNTLCETERGEKRFGSTGTH